MALNSLNSSGPVRPLQFVHALVFNPEGKVLVGESIKPESCGAYLVPAGKVKPHEEDRVEDALLRELHEEAGVLRKEVLKINELRKFTMKAIRRILYNGERYDGRADRFFQVLVRAAYVPKPDGIEFGNLWFEDIESAQILLAMGNTVYGKILKMLQSSKGEFN